MKSNPAFLLPRTFICCLCKRKVIKSRGYKADVINPGEACCKGCSNHIAEIEMRKTLHSIGLTEIYEYVYNNNP